MQRAVVTDSPCKQNVYRTHSIRQEMLYTQTHIGCCYEATLNLASLKIFFGAELAIMFLSGTQPVLGFNSQ